MTDQKPTFDRTNCRWRTFVLSLPRARPRRLEAIQQIQAAGVPFEIVDAVDGKALRPELLEPDPKGWRMSPGEVACYLSHIGMLERVCDYGLDFAIILEDDFALKPIEAISLGNLWEHLPEDMDHVQLHNMGSHFYDGYKVSEPGHHFNRLECTNVCTIGYVASRLLAEFVLEHFRRPSMPIDHLYVQISKACPDLVFYDMNERLIDARWDLPSEIER